MISFKKFLVEKIVGNTGWVYHRTKENPEESDILKYGIKPSSNQSAMYGKGLYCCYDINQQLKPDMEHYGDYILKGKIDLNGFAILDSDIYGLANQRGNFQEHLRQIGTDMESVQDTIPYTSRIAQDIWEKCKQDGYNGIVFTGQSDGKVAVIWNRRNFIPYQYSEDNAATWKTLTPDIKSIKRPHDPEYDKDDQAIKFSKILKELSNKEDIGDLTFPDSYKSKVFLKNLKKSGSIYADNATELNLPQLQKSGYIGADNVRELNLPQLQTSGGIGANSATELNLPQLQKSGYINADSVRELNLPQLQTSGSIYAYNATEINLPQLQTIEDIDASSATEINLPQLQTSGSIHAHKVTELNLPELQTSRDINASNAKEINLTQLQESGYINASNAKEINLPQLRMIKGITTYLLDELNLPELIYVEYGGIITDALRLNMPKLAGITVGKIEATKVTKLDLPNLRSCGGIDAPLTIYLNLPELMMTTETIHVPNAITLNIPKLGSSLGSIKAPKAKKIIIPKESVSILKDVPDDCEIIHPEDTPQIKVDENTTFKKYLMLKEKSSLLNEWTRELMPEIYAALEKYDDPMVGVHFTKGIPERFGEKKRVPHIGLNLHPFHQDPIGIYAFPKDYVLSGQLEANSSFTELTNYYIVKPSLKANILNLSKMTDEDAINILRQMGVDENEYKSADIYHKSGKMEAGHRFWGTLEKMRKKIYGDYDKNLSWNKLFKKTPYNVLYDEGGAIIHNNEPSQIVYLDSSAMEVLDQGKQDDPVNKVYSFFIENFPELRPQKTKDHWGAKVLKLVSNKGYDLIILLPNRIESYSKIRVDIKDQNLGKSRSLGEFEMNGNLEDFVIDIKEKLTRLESEYFKDRGEREVPPVLEGISKRFNIKLKKDDRGDWEIRQKYQDGDKDYVVTFYIRAHNNSVIFILSKNQKMKSYNTFGYNENAIIDYKEDYSPEEIVNMGLKELESKRYGSISINHSAMKTIEFLRKRVFGL